MENELELRVINSTVGVLDTTIDTIEVYVDGLLEKYDPKKFEGDADSARKARAELNNGKKDLQSKRIAIINRMMAPYRDFETRCKAVEKKMETASSAVDVIVKAKENEEKDAKKAVIQSIFDGKNFELFPIDKVFNPKWLNKGSKITDISREIDAIIDKSYNDLKLIEKYTDDQSEVDLLKAMYLDTLDLDTVLEKSLDLKKNRELVARESETRADRAIEASTEERKRELMHEEVSMRKKNLMNSLVADCLEVEVKEPVKKTYTFTFTATEEQRMKFEQYIIEQGIEYNNLQEIDF